MYLVNSENYIYSKQNLCRLPIFLIFFTWCLYIRRFSSICFTTHLQSIFILLLFVDLQEHEYICFAEPCVSHIFPPLRWKQSDCMHCKYISYKCMYFWVFGIYGFVYSLRVLICCWIPWFPSKSIHYIHY